MGPQFYHDIMQAIAIATISNIGSVVIAYSRIVSRLAVLETENKMQLQDHKDLKKKVDHLWHGGE